MAVSWHVLAVANACEMGYTGAAVNIKTKNVRLIFRTNVYLTVIYLSCVLLRSIVWRRDSGTFLFIKAPCCSTETKPVS